MPSDGARGPFVHRYLPLGIGVVVAVSFLLVWHQQGGTPVWLTVLNGAAVCFSLIVQYGTIRNHPEQYPEVIGRGE